MATDTDRLLREMHAMLNRLYRGGAASSKSARNRRSIPVDLDKISNTFRNTSNFLDNVSIGFKDLISTSLSLKKMFIHMQDEVGELTNSLNQVDKRYADSILKQIEAGKLNLKDVSAASEAMIKYTESVDRLSVLNASNNKRKKELNNLDDGTVSITKKINAEKIASAKVMRERTKDVIKNANAVKNLTGVDKLLTAEELKYVHAASKNRRGALAGAKTLHKFNNKASIAGKVFTGAGRAVRKHTSDLKTALRSIPGALFKFGKEFFKAAAPIVFSDYMAQLKYFVSSSNYTLDRKLGIREGERAQNIGENRILLRQLGGTRSSQPGFDKNIMGLQHTAYIFGVYAKDAVELSLKYAQLTKDIGGQKLTSKAIEQQMHFMKGLAVSIGVTDDQLRKFYVDLSDSGNMAMMTFAGLSDNTLKQSSAINAEIAIRLKNNVLLGRSTRLMAQQIQMQINQQHRGIETQRLSTVARGVLPSFAREFGVKLSKGDAILMRRGITDFSSLNASEQAHYSIVRQILLARFAERKKELAKSGDMSKLGAMNTLSEVYKLPTYIGTAANENRALEGIRKTAGAMGMRVDALLSGLDNRTITSKSTNFLGNVNTKSYENPLKSVNNSLNLLGTNAFLAATALKTLSNNPIAAGVTAGKGSLGVVATGVMGYLHYKLGSKALDLFKSGGSSGAAEGAEVGIGTKLINILKGVGKFTSKITSKFGSGAAEGAEATGVGEGASAMEGLGIGIEGLGIGSAAASVAIPAAIIGGGVLLEKGVQHVIEKTSLPSILGGFLSRYIGKTMNIDNVNKVEGISLKNTYKTFGDTSKSTKTYFDSVINNAMSANKSNNYTKFKYEGKTLSLSELISKYKEEEKNALLLNSEDKTEYQKKQLTLLTNIHNSTKTSAELAKKKLDADNETHQASARPAIRSAIRHADYLRKQYGV